MRYAPAVLVLGVSCNSGIDWHWSETPMGYVVAWKNEDVPAEIPALLDAAIDRAVLRVSTEDGISLGGLYEMMDVQRYYLFPGAFETDDSPTGWASGQALPGAFALAWRLPGSVVDFPALEHEIRHKWYRDWNVGH